MGQESLPGSAAGFLARVGNIRAIGALVALSVLLLLITSATFSALGIVLPDMVKSMNWTWSEAGLGFTVLGASCGGSSWLPALLIRRIGVRATLIVGTLVITAGLAGFGFCTGLWMFLASACACGVGYQMMAYIPSTHVIAASFEHSERPLGFYFAFGSLGGIAGPWLVFGIMDLFAQQWRQYWMVQAVIALVVGVTCAIVVGRLSEKPTKTGDGKPVATNADQGWTVAEALRTPQFYVLAAAYFAHLLAGVTVASLSVAHLTERGVSVAIAGAMLSVESLVQLGGRLATGALGDWINPKHLLVFALAVDAFGCFALSVATNNLTLLVYAIGTGLGFGLTAYAVTVLLLKYYGREHNLEIFSLTCLVGALSALGPVIGGLMRDSLGSFAPTFQLFGGVVALVCLVAVFMRAPQRKPLVHADQLSDELTSIAEAAVRAEIVPSAAE